MKPVFVKIEEVVIGDRVRWETKGDCWHGTVIKVNAKSVIVDHVNKYTNTADQVYVSKAAVFVRVALVLEGTS